MVSICGGEPADLSANQALDEGLSRQKRIVYVCASGAMFMRKKMPGNGSLANSERGPFAAEAKICELLAAGLLSGEKMRRHSEGPKDPTAWKPNDRAEQMDMMERASRDGRKIERTHDAYDCRSAKASLKRPRYFAMVLAKQLGYQVAANTTIYKETLPWREIEQMFHFLISWRERCISRPGTMTPRRREHDRRQEFAHDRKISSAQRVR